MANHIGRLHIVQPTFFMDFPERRGMKPARINYM
jgi:hypothetical protein